MTKLEPRPYQADAIKWLQQHKRGLLMDVPGLGKTIQASEAAQRPVLVACPTYLVRQWVEFLGEQYPVDKVIAVEGTRLERFKALKEHADWHIINIEMFRSYPLPVKRTLIIDEAHHVKGHTSIQARVAQKYAEGCPYVFLLTATPVKREIDDWYMLLRIVAPKSFSSYWSFVNTYCNLSNDGFRDKISGPKYPALFQRMISKYTLGRTYQQVGQQVPPLIETTVPICPGKEFYKIYNKLRRQYTIEDIQLSTALEVYRILRMVTMTEKLDAIKNLVDDNGPAVVFSWYRDSAESVGKALNCPVITGEMDASIRRKVAYEAPHSISVTIASLSEGIDLTKYRHVIFAEEDYTPGSTYQAVCRVRRPGSNLDPVKVNYLVVLGTIDSAVRRAVQARRSSIREIIKDALR